MNWDEVYLLEKGAVEFYDKAGIDGGMVFSEFKKAWTMLLRRGEGVVWYLKAAGESQAVGALGGTLGIDPSNGQKIFREAFYYIREDYRGVGAKLLKEAEEKLKELGVKRIYMISLLYYEHEKVSRLYEAMGYEKAEMLWMKEV